eukprot:4772206-Ditylum_brightwellii.AAC.1
MEEIFVMSEESKARFVRRIMMKILLAQQQNYYHPAPGEEENNYIDKLITFTWATGGDSAAAGHGNLFNQSYTAIMENTVRSSFASLGVKFVAKNYGIGGYGSGPELALCQESERFDQHRAMLWGERAGTHPTKPILFMMDSGYTERWKQFKQLDTK